MRMVLLLSMIACAAAAQAEELTIPNTFSSGTPAVAAEVNANFAAVDVAVDDNAADIDLLQAGQAGLESDVAKNAGDISALVQSVNGVQSQADANSSGIDFLGAAVSGLAANQVEVGFDFSSTDGLLAIATTPTAVSSVTVTAPGPGHLVADVSAYIRVIHSAGATSDVVCAIKTDTGSPASTVGRLLGSAREFYHASTIATSSYYPTLSAKGVFQVPSAGNFTLNTVCSSGAGTTADIAYRTMTAVYYSDRY